MSSQSTLNKDKKRQNQQVQPDPRRPEQVRHKRVPESFDDPPEKEQKTV